MDRIFLSIASYRDPDLINTIKDAYKRADRPDRITFGVLFQGTKEEMNTFLSEAVGKMNVKYVHHNDTKGTGWARNILTKDMLQDEEYWLQIDSHTRFIQGWDTKLIDLYNKIGEDCLISAYPPHFGMNEPYEVYTTKTLNNKALVEGFTDVFSFENTVGKIPEQEYEESITAAGAFQFTKRHVAKSMTFDAYFNPWMDQEISSCLAWMNGFNIYAPRDAILWHCYEDNHIGSDEKWRGLVADEVKISGYEQKPFDIIKHWHTKRNWNQWKDRVLVDINDLKKEK